MIKNEKIENNKVNKRRSNNYPINSIPKCLALIKETYSLLNTAKFSNREEIANAKGVSVSWINRLLSSSVQYGLLEMKSSRGYRITTLYEQIRTSLNRENTKTLLLECLCSPKIYQALINEFEGGNLPNIDDLGIILTRKHNITENVSSVAAEIFLTNAYFVGVIGNNRVLSVAKHIGSNLYFTVFKTHRSNIEHNPSKETSPEDAVSELYDIIPMPLPDNRRFLMNIPKGMTADDWLEVKEWVGFLSQKYLDKD